MRFKHSPVFLAFLTSICFGVTLVCDASDGVASSRRSTDTSSSNTYEAVRQAHVLLKRGRYEEAKSLLNQIIARDSKDPEAFVKRAQADNQLGSFADALKDCTSAIALNSKYIDAYYQRAYAKAGLRDYKAAIADFSQVLKLRPTMSKCLLMRGNLFAEEHDYKSAISDLVKYAEAADINRKELGSDLTPTYFVLATCYRKLSQRSKEREQYSKVIQAGQNCDAYRLRGDSYLAEKNYSKAIADYSDALKIDPDVAHCLEFRAQAYTAIGDKAHAQQDLKAFEHIKNVL